MIQVNLFLNEIYSFLRTCTIKNEYIADSKRIEEILRLRVTEIDDVDNPYYINLLGDYSPLDTEMTVKSLDFPDTEIVFNKENLLSHPKTKFAYQIPNKWFDNLVSRYPTQVDLIKNILYPVTLEELTASESLAVEDIIINNGGDLAEATYKARRDKTILNIVALRNFSLLQYDHTQLEPQEVSSLIGALKSQLSMFAVRWDVKEFRYEDFYPMTLWSVLWSTLPNLLLSQRIENLRTTAVHSTHIWEYLTSKGLGDYRSILTHKQQMFLYKNMDYLIKTRGKDGTLSILADELLKSHNVTLRSKSIILNKGNDEDAMELTGTPIAEIISSDIRDNTSPSQDGANGYETVEQIFHREHADGLEPILSDSLIRDQEVQFSHAKETWLPTKLVELNKIDLYTSEHNNFVKFVLETILYRQNLRAIDYNVTVRPRDTEIDLNLTPGEVIALAFYCAEREFNQGSIMTAEAIELYLGKELIDEDGNVTVITEGNKATFIGKTIETVNGEYIAKTDGHPGGFLEHRAPNLIPGNARLTMPYKDIMPDPIEREFYYSDVKYDICRIMDIDSKVDRIQTNVGQIATPKKFLELIDGQFSVLNKDLEGLRSSSNASYHIAFDKLYSQLRVNGLFDMNLDIPYATYDEWFDSNVQLRSVIDQIDDNLNPGIAFAELSNSLLLALIPLEDATSTVFSNFTSNDFRLMKRLFIQLCSYNITFLDTDRQLRSYLRFTPIVVRDQTESQISMESTFQMPDISNREIECVERTTKIEIEVDMNKRSIREVEHIVPLTVIMPEIEETVERAIVIPLHQRQLVTDNVTEARMALPWDSFKPKETLPEINNDIAYINSIMPNHIKQGLRYSYWESPDPDLTELPDFSTLTFDKVGISLNTTPTDVREVNSRYALAYDGYLWVEDTDDWTLYCRSDDGSRLYIDDELIVDNNFVQDNVERSANVPLTRGLHKIRIEFFERTGLDILVVSWETATLAKEVIPNNSLFYI